MTTRAQVWESFATRTLAAMLMGRQLPLRPDDDFHFSEELAAMAARFADHATEEWATRFDLPPKQQCTSSPTKVRKP